MGQKKLWLLCVTFASFFFLTNPSPTAETVVKGRVGGTVEMGCTLPSLSDGVMTPNLFPLHVVEWVRLSYNVPILIKFGDYTPRVHPNYKGRVSLSRGASLVVDGLTMEDEGWFECRILFLDRSADEFRNGTWTFLSITAPPVFIQIPPSFVEVLLGESLTLNCGAHGNPKPTVTWRKEDNTVEEEDKIEVISGTLSLVKVTRETAGMYKCHVSNSEGNLTHITQLEVKGPPVIVIPPEDTTMNMSQDAVLQCHADAYPSNLTYEWQKDGQNVYNVESLKSRVKILVDGTLHISELIPEDTGNYTCIPSNGLLMPPLASAYLKVQHPARVVQMPRETYLPSGMGGTLVCPVQAEPPQLFVIWTKDGVTLDLRQYPGWMINSKGSVFIATANDDAVGTYTCTAYNSYGTMGQSEPTKVVLKDPPTFLVSPEAEYLQEVGRELVIPCQAYGDPAPKITWTKVGSSLWSPFTVSSNGSLVLHPVTKNHQGTWECHATNSLATVSKGTVVLVLGTSPHAVTAVSIEPGINNANVSWEPGFDGGYTQEFSIWVKPTNRGKHEWTSLPVPISESSLLVTGLQPITSYQFSILPQNKLGSGPFSEIITIMTLAPSTDQPTLVNAVLLAPTSLSVNYTEVGVLLQWLLPPAQSPLITAFMIQARQENGEWVVLDREINANATEILVQGLARDSCYELRLLSYGYRIVSDPSETVNITTKGMEVYPAPPSLMNFVTQPLMAGVIAGVCFLFVTITLSVVTACFMKHKRERRHRKRRDVISTALQKARTPQASLPNGSPNSILKMKLCPPLNFFPNSSSSSDRSSFDKGSRSEYQDQKKQLLPSSPAPPCYTLFESHLGGSPSSLTAIESISRGPDGRFIAQTHLEDSVSMHNKTKKELHQCPVQDNHAGSKSNSFRGSPKACSFRPEKLVCQEDLLSTVQDSYSKSLKQRKEQEYMESCITSHKAEIYEKEQRQTKSASPVRRWAGLELEPISKLQDIPLRKKAQRPSSLTQQISEYRKGCYFGNTSSPMERLLTSTSPYIQWDISPVTSPTSQAPVLNLLEGNTPDRILLETPNRDLNGVEDSAAKDISHSQFTQCISLSIHSHQRDSLSCYETDVSKALAKCSERPIDRELSSTKNLTEDDGIQEGEIKTQAYVSMSTCSDLCHLQNPRAFVQNSLYSDERDKDSRPNGHLPNPGSNLSHSFTGSITITYDNQKINSEIKTGDKPSSLSLQPEEEKEGIRSRSRKSDKCVFSVSPNRISPLPLFENEVESDHSHFSVGLSESLKAKRMSPLQPSTILEYLSLPGFVEMSVDEPTEDYQSAESTWLSTKQVNGTLIRGEPDVVPKNWENQGHYQVEACDDQQNRILVDHKIPNNPKESYIPEKATNFNSCVELAGKNTSINSGSSETKCFSKQYVAHEGRCLQPLLSHKSIVFDKPTSLSPAKPLVNAKIVYNIPYQNKSTEKSLSENAQWCQLQNKRTNQVSARISQAPVPFMKKSISIGPCKTLVSMGQPCPYLKKSASLGSQNWEHQQSSRTYVSNNYHKDELPHLSVKDRSYNLGCTPANTYLRPGQVTGHAKSYSGYGLERPYYSERPYMSNSSFMHTHRPAVLNPPKHLEPYRQELDPRRQATVFSESPRCAPSYQETLRLVQHRYVPHGPPHPLSAPRLARWDHARPMDFRKCFQRPYLPRGYSWPSPHQAAFPPGEIQRELYGVVDMVEGGDTNGEGVRSSYASQSSGRGSAGPFAHLRQSLSITPTLLSSPETTEEWRKRESCLRDRRSKRNTSVDESYEFDATECRIGRDLLEAVKIEETDMGQGRELIHDRCLTSTGLQGFEEKGPFVSGSLASQPPQQQFSHSLSEARFCALMQEFHEYRRTKESYSQDPHPLLGPNHDSESAL
ncbi:protein turtle-like A, partial [Silurus meridionalis]